MACFYLIALHLFFCISSYLFYFSSSGGDEIGSIDFTSVERLILYRVYEEKILLRFGKLSRIISFI